MEEREHHPSKHGGNIRSSSLPEAPSFSDPHQQVFPKPDQPGTFGHGTYIVQVPRDQVYRIPPPENAIYVKKYRKNNQGNTKGSSFCGSCSYCTFIWAMIIVLIGAIIGSFVGIFSIYDDPSFSIEYFLVKKLKKNLEYEISIKVLNPNKHHGISYNQDGSNNVVLFLKKKEIGEGKFPKLDQFSKGSTIINVILHGSNSKLPKEISTSKTHSKKRISLSLSMKNVGVKLKFGPLHVKSKKIDVSCSFLVDRFDDKGAHVVTQECTSSGG